MGIVKIVNHETGTTTFEEREPEPVSNELAAKMIRERRDFLLVTEVDPVVSNPLRWNDMSEVDKQSITDYRKSLLDITLQQGFPTSVEWPELNIGDNTV